MITLPAPDMSDAQYRALELAANAADGIVHRGNGVSLSTLISLADRSRGWATLVKTTRTVRGQQVTRISGARMANPGRAAHALVAAQRAQAARNVTVRRTSAVAGLADPFAVFARTGGPAIPF